MFGRARKIDKKLYKIHKYMDTSIPRMFFIEELRLVKETKGEYISDSGLRIPKTSVIRGSYSAEYRWTEKEAKTCREMMVRSELETFRARLRAIKRNIEALTKELVELNKEKGV